MEYPSFGSWPTCQDHLRPRTNSSQQSGQRFRERLVRVFTQTSGQSAIETKSIYSPYTFQHNLQQQQVCEMPRRSAPWAFRRSIKKPSEEPTFCGSLSSQPQAQAYLYLLSLQLNTRSNVFSRADRPRTHLFPQRTPFPGLRVYSVNFMWKQSPRSFVDYVKHGSSLLQE